MTAVLQILLFVLKCLGILLLGILGLLVLLTLSVLFAPVRYRGRIEKKEAPEEIFRADGLVSWLNPLLRVRIRYTEKKLHYTVRLFGWCLLDSNKPKKDKPVKEKRKKASKKSRKKQKAERETVLSVTEEKEITPATGNLLQGDSSKGTEGNIPSDMSGTTDKGTAEAIESQEISGSDNHRKKASLFAKIKQVIEKIKAIPGKIKQKVTHFINTVKLLWYKKEKVSAFLQDELHKKALGTAGQIIKKLLRHVLPGTIKGKLEFGTGDPASTGKALGVLGVLYAWYGKGLTVIPDFYEKRIVAEVFFKGRIRGITVLIQVLRLLRDKQISRLRRNWKKLVMILKQKTE